MNQWEDRSSTEGLFHSVPTIEALLKK